MERNNYEELKQLLDGIQKAIQMYNEINPKEKVSLVKEEQKDVSNLFVCVYNDNHVGLFKKINCCSSRGDACVDGLREDANYYFAGSVYIGVDSNYIGIKVTHLHDLFENRWELVGSRITVDGKSYVSNCRMQNGMSFDDMRLIMYSNGLIDSYELGKATSKEMLDVLKYAVTYYQLNNNMQNQKKK